MKRLLMLVVVLLLVCSSALSHSGGTDSKGGHTNHSTGEYHYHHGYPAHDHEDGICPYESSGKSASTATNTANGGLYSSNSTATYYRTTANVNMRSSASSSSSLLHSIPEGTMVQYKGAKSGNWIKVYYNGLTGWCHSDYLVFLRTATLATVVPTERPIMSTVTAEAYVPHKAESSSNDILWIICVSFSFGLGAGLFILIVYSNKVSAREARAAAAARLRESQAVELGRQMAFAEMQRGQHLTR